MKTIYSMASCGYRMRSRHIPMREEIPSGWYDSQNIAEKEFKKIQENRVNEYKELMPKAMKILEQKELELMDAITSLGCDVFTTAEAHDDMGLDSWLTLEISLVGKFGSYSYLSEIRI